MVDDLFDVTVPPKGDDDDTATVVLRVHVQPGAGRTAVMGRHGTALKLRVAAPPEGGRANEACGALLAETFALRPGDVELTGGASSRMKRFRLRDVGLVEFRRKLERLVEDGNTGMGPKGRSSH